MKKTFGLALMLLVVLALFAPEIASAHGGGGGHWGGGHWGGAHHHGGHFGHRAHIGVVIGAPLFVPWFYPPPVYYAPVAPSAPPVYIERGDASGSTYWYRCDDPQGYYPYVRECPSGWRRETPRPPPD